MKKQNYEVVLTKIKTLHIKADNIFEADRLAKKACEIFGYDQYDYESESENDIPENARLVDFDQENKWINIRINGEINV